MKRLLLLLLGLSFVVSLTGCHALIQVGEFPKAPQVYGGIRTMKNSSPLDGLGILGPGGRELAGFFASLYHTIDLLAPAHGFA